MKKIYIFDVDGTLTPSRQPMTEKFLEFFNSWSKGNSFYLVTGSDLDKTKEQVPRYILERAEAVFTCCGNEMWVKEKQEYRKEFKPPNTLLTYLGDRVRMSDYPIKAGNHIEDRGTLLNFSIVGRECTQEQRKEIARTIGFRWSELDAVIGGQISIDIYPKGNDKSQVLKHICNDKNEYLFIGDGIDNRGNDYPLARLMNNTENCSSYQTRDWKHTKLILESFNG